MEASHSFFASEPMQIIILGINTSNFALLMCVQKAATYMIILG